MRQRDRMYLINYNIGGGRAVYRSRLPHNAELELWWCVVSWLDEHFSLGSLIVPDGFDFYVAGWSGNKVSG